MALLRSKKVIKACENQAIDIKDVETVDLEEFLRLTAPAHAADFKNAMVALEEVAKGIEHKISWTEQLVAPLDTNEAVDVVKAFLDTPIRYPRWWSSVDLRTWRILVDKT